MSCLGILPEELEEVSEEREVWVSLLRLRLGPDNRTKMDGWMDGIQIFVDRDFNLKVEPGVETSSRVGL